MKLSFLLYFIGIGVAINGMIGVVGQFEDEATMAQIIRYFTGALKNQTFASRIY